MAKIDDRSRQNPAYRVGRTDFFDIKPSRFFRDGFVLCFFRRRARSACKSQKTAGRICKHAECPCRLCREEGELARQSRDLRSAPPNRVVVFRVFLSAKPANAVTLLCTFFFEKKVRKKAIQEAHPPERPPVKVQGGAYLPRRLYQSKGRSAVQILKCF